MNKAEKEGSKRDYWALRNFIEQSANYREDLVRVLDLNFDDPNKELKDFAEKNNLNLKKPEVQENFRKIRKQLIEKINGFYENNFLKMDPSAVKEVKKEQREYKKKKKLEAKQQAPGTKEPKIGTTTPSTNTSTSTQNKENVSTNNTTSSSSKDSGTSIKSQLVFFSTIILGMAIVLYIVLYVLED